MHFLMIEAHPRPNHPDYGTIDSALVTFYINEALVRAPEATARLYIEGRGWDVAEICESYSLTIDSLEVDHPARRSFEQALVEGMVARFNMRPLRRPK